MITASRIVHRATIALLPLAITAGSAAADTGQSAAPAIAGIDIASVLVGVAIALGGVAALLGGLSTVLHAIAPRTRTTVDDRIADLVDELHGRVDVVHER